MVIIGQQESQFLKAEVLKKLKIGNKRGHPDWGYQFTSDIPSQENKVQNQYSMFKARQRSMGIELWAIEPKYSPT